MSTQYTPPLPFESSDVWIISEPRPVDIALADLDLEPISGPTRMQYLSAIGRYLLNPKPIEVQRRLVGCEIHYTGHRAVSTKTSAPKRRRLSLRSAKLAGDTPEMILSRSDLKLPRFKDPALEAHIRKIMDHLRPHNPVIRLLHQLDTQQVGDLIGICDDLGGGRWRLKLRGDVQEKIDFLTKHLLDNVAVILAKPHVADGLFELRGFAVDTYRPQEVFRLIHWVQDGKPRCCVVNPELKFDFWAQDLQLLKYLQLLNQSLQADPNLKDAFQRSVTAQITPIKLFFNKKLDVDYGKAPFPKIYRDVFQSCRLGAAERNLVKPVLNYYLLGVSCSYIQPSDLSGDTLFTHVTIMQDVRALESLKKSLPQVYSEICRRAMASDIGHFYLLDSIKGFSHAG